ncbi:hypothetical protein [Phenylobacterium sp.]|uniref:hypothetical protein n=1 Tax=Phenylobacterium sp. TaxID=1871053 RepID=UPI002F95E758
MALTVEVTVDRPADAYTVRILSDPRREPILKRVRRRAEAFGAERSVPTDAVPADFDRWAHHTYYALIRDGLELGEALSEQLSFDGSVP